MSDHTILRAYRHLLKLKSDGYAHDDLPDDQRRDSDGERKRQRRQETLESIVEQTPATSIDGAICKLEHLIHQLDGSRWIDRTLADQGFDALYARRGEMEGHAQQLAEAIRDLLDVRTERLRPFAEAWIDRWRALGGGFGWVYKANGEKSHAVRSIPMSYTWTPPTYQNQALRPHEWILDESDHTGAVKMLESLLTLVPGAREAVSALAREKRLYVGEDGLPTAPFPEAGEA